MSDRLKGKRAFVTAAAAGIGRACALAFAREGATVFATDIDETRIAALRDQGVAEVARLDVRDSAAVAAIAKRAGKTDILLNAAGFVHHGTCSSARTRILISPSTSTSNRCTAPSARSCRACCKRAAVPS
jgi:NAD(P)-dependent dehydrogenase (short-subunit alcohol dehydrogenase family)